MLEILFFADSDWVSKLIRWRLGSPYSHTAIIANGIVFESHWPCVRSLDRLEAVDYASTMVANAQIPAMPEQITKGINWAAKQIGDGYDLADFFALGIGFFGIEVPKHYICSTFVADFLSAAGIRFYDDPSLQTPATLARDWHAQEVKRA